MRSPGRRWIVGAGVATLLTVAASGSALAAGSPPEVIQLSYFESSGDQGADRGLEAFARHTHAVRFATTFQGRTARAAGRYRDSITDTDIKGKQAKHPWTPNRKEGGGRVIRLVHKSLHTRGFAKVRLRARKSGEAVGVRVRIDLSKCASDPPLYPVDCEVRVS
jgi:hypothetical protein